MYVCMYVCVLVIVDEFGGSIDGCRLGHADAC
jgi:hypothetical protein